MRKVASIARIMLVAATLGLVGLRSASASESLSWEDLLAPYSRGTPLPGGFRIDGVCYGTEHDVVIVLDGPDGDATIEVHVLQRGRWEGIRESRSFGIGYETSRSPAAERETVTELLAETVRSRDRGLPPPNTIALGPAFEGSVCRTLPSEFERLEVLERSLPVRAIQIAWALLIVAAPFLCWRVARATGGGAALLLVVGVSVVLATAATWGRPDEPLHANGHAWREAREVLAPWGQDDRHAAAYLHGRGGIALQWLVARAERTFTGSADPFRISRVASAAAAGATALLAALVVGSPWAGLAAGVVLAGMPLAQMLAVSGSALAIPAAILPWSFGLLIAARRFDDGLLLAGAALAAALGTLSHTAMLAWPAAWVAAGVLAATRNGRPPRARWFALAAFVVAAAWGLQLWDCLAMLANRDPRGGAGLLHAAWSGFRDHDLMVDPRWVSPLLAPLVLMGLVAAFRRRLASRGAPLLVAVLGCVPFFAVTACSSDAIRYQGAVLGLGVAIAVAGLWELPASRRLGPSALTLLRIALLATLVLLPLPSWREPTDPVAIEHRLVDEGVRRMAPGTLVVLPKGRFDLVIVDFPDFLLPRDSRVAFVGDADIETYEGARLIYLGLACISWTEAESGSEPADMRPECRALRTNAHPWFVRSLGAEDLPRGRDGKVWTFHRLATGVPFGFFALD